MNLAQCASWATSLRGGLLTACAESCRFPSQVFSSDSFCVASRLGHKSLVLVPEAWQHARPVCMKLACGMDDTLSVIMENTRVSCPLQGGIVSGTATYNLGNLTCPSYESVCITEARRIRPSVMSRPSVQTVQPAVWVLLNWTAPVMTSSKPVLSYLIQVHYPAGLLCT
jgi:hypothetical protein